MRNAALIAFTSVVLTACGGANQSSSSDESENSSLSTPSSTRPASSSFSSINPQPSSSETTSESSLVMSSSSSISSSEAAEQSSSEPATQSSSSVATGTARYSDYVADAVKGKERYETQAYSNLSCATCHGNDGEGTTPIDLNKFNSAQALFTVIHDTMPTQVAGPEECEGQCAADITAYLLTWKSPGDNGPVACDTTKAIRYSPRALRVLTQDEYQNSLEDLLGLDEDYRNKIIGDADKGGFPNNVTANIDDSRTNKYWAAAEGIAKWALENGKPEVCGDGSGCSYSFVNDFLPRMFRRPLTQAETDTFEKIFTDFSGKEGLETALVAALNAPQFLYRSELGRKVSEVLNTDPEPYYRAVPPATTIPIGSPDESGFASISYYVGQNTGYAWTGNDIMVLPVKALPGNNGEWPSTKLRTKGQTFEPEVVDSVGGTVLTWEFNGDPGGDSHIHFDQQLPNGAKLFFGPVTIGKRELYTPSKGDVAKMEKADSDSYILDPYEYATLLAYTLTGSTPDAALLDAAANEGLHYEADIIKQVERLIDSPRGRERMGAMAGYWFSTNKVTSPVSDRDMTLFPNYTDDVRLSMAEEVREMFREIFYGGHPFEQLYTGDFTVLNKTLSDYYGIPSASGGANDWQLVDSLDKRGGIITSGAFMTVNAHPDKTAPIVRAVRVREQMLCQHILPPPLLVEDREAQLLTVNADYENGQMTSRQYYEGITDAESCRGCHEYQINPLFGMEDFDQAGQWRDTTKGATGMDLVIDNSGRLYGPDNPDDEVNFIEFNGAKALSKIVGGLDGIEACLIEKSFRFVTGMPLHDKAVDDTQEVALTTEQESDFACVADQAKATYAASNHSVRSVITEMVMQDLMRFRKD